jgi:hypothetical protein
MCFRIYVDTDKREIELANILQRNITAYALPLVIQEQQKNSLERIYGSCHHTMHAMMYLHICCTCVLNGKGFKTKLRMCALSGKLICDECRVGNIMKISMVGIILRLCTSNIFLCPTCCQVCMWTGSGLDLSVCSCKNTIKSPEKTCCSVCSSRYVVAGPMLYTDLERSRISKVFLCGKHLIPKHMLDLIDCYSQLQVAIRRKREKKHTITAKVYI